MIFAALFAIWEFPVPFLGTSIAHVILCLPSRVTSTGITCPQDSFSPRNPQSIDTGNIPSKSSISAPTLGVPRQASLRDRSPELSEPFVTLGFCKSGKQHKTCSSALCTKDDASYFLVIRLGPKTSECEKNVTVVSTVTGCDVTNCATTLHAFNKHASSRREAVLDSRGVPRCTEINSTRSTLADMCRSFDSSTSPYVLLATRLYHLSSSCQLPRELVSLSFVPYQASISICRIVHVPALVSRYRSGSHQS